MWYSCGMWIFVLIFIIPLVMLASVFVALYWIIRLLVEFAVLVYERCTDAPDAAG